MTHDKQVSISPLYSACLPIIESKSILDHNRKLLQALDDDLKWVLSKNVNNYIHFQCSLMLIVPLFQMYSCKHYGYFVFLMKKQVILI